MTTAKITQALSESVWLLPGPQAKTSLKMSMRQGQYNNNNNAKNLLCSAHITSNFS